MKQNKRFGLVTILSKNYFTFKGNSLYFVQNALMEILPPFNGIFKSQVKDNPIMCLRAFLHVLHLTLIPH